MTAISARGVTKDFGPYRAVDNVSFDVEAGLVTGFVGVNGSGKTTTMRAMLGLTPLTAGKVHFDGVPYQELAHPRRTVGAVVDRIGAHPSHSARQHLTMIATDAGLAPQRVESVLDEVGLLDVADNRLRTYSMGMTQRCALAAALLGSPNTLVLDEPANGLDPAGIRWLRVQTRAWADEGRAVLVSTHQLAELAAIVDHLLVLHNGRLVHDGPVQELLRTGERLESVVFELLADANADYTSAVRS